jgi:hypothetical protein
VEEACDVSLFRRRPPDDDPLAGLRGDGSLTPFATSAPEPARAPGGSGSGPGPIGARYDTGVLSAGRPRLRLTIEVTPPGRQPFQLEANVVVPEGTAAEVGDTADVAYDDGRLTEVRLRPAIRPARPPS